MGTSITMGETRGSVGPLKVVATGNEQLQAYALCLSIESGGPITTTSKGKAAKTSTVTR